MDLLTLSVELLLNIEPLCQRQVFGERTCQISLRQVLINSWNRHLLWNYSCCCAVMGNAHCEQHNGVFLSVTTTPPPPSTNAEYNDMYIFIQHFVLYQVFLCPWWRILQDNNCNKWNFLPRRKLQGRDLAVCATEVKQNHSLKIETVDPNPEEGLLRDGMRAGQTPTGYALALFHTFSPSLHTPLLQAV